MPELPEVETIVRALRDSITGKTVRDFELFHPRSSRHTNPKRLIEICSGNTIKNLSRRGKYILLNWENELPGIAIHLRMSGQLLLSEKVLASKHLRARFNFSDGTYLNFVDIRTFGTIFILDGNEPGGYKTLGIEPLSSKFTVDKLVNILEKSSTAIKQFLLNQNKIAGIGNIYASEICFLAGISPTRPANSISYNESILLHSNILAVLNRAINEMGTTLSDFRKPDGTPGEFSNSLKVYGREKKKCVICQTKIQRVVQHGRSTFFCPRCQH